MRTITEPLAPTEAPDEASTTAAPDETRPSETPAPGRADAPGIRPSECPARDAAEALAGSRSPGSRPPGHSRGEAAPTGNPAPDTAAPLADAAATQADVLTLAQWLSPGFPVGAYAYSHGLEWAIAEGSIADAPTLRGWLSDVIAHGTGRSDAILLAAAHRAASAAELTGIARTARAFAPSRERLAETTLQGAALCATLRAVWGLDLPDLPYPVALGRACRLHDLPLPLAAAMHLHAFAANLVSAAVRAVPLGQTDGQAILAALAPLCRDVAAAALREGLDDLSATAFLSDVASMRHETQPVRIFRS